MVTATFKNLFLNFLAVYVVNAKVDDIQLTKHSNLITATSNLISILHKNTDYALITISTLSSKKSQSEVNLFGNELLKEVNTNIPAVIRGNERKWREIEKKSATTVLIIDSFEDYKVVKSKLKRNFPKYYVIVLLSGRFKECDKIVKDFWKFSIFNVNFLEANDTHVAVYSYFPFQEGKCGTDLSLTLFNSFDFKTQNWKNVKFYPEKVKNLYNCTLNVGTSQKVPMIIATNHSNGEISFHGSEVLLIKTLSAEFNFSINFTLYDGSGTVTKNVSTGLRGALYRQEVDIGISGSSLQTNRMEYMSPSSMINSVPIVIVFPPPSLKSPFEKLYLPFDVPTWLLLFFIFIAGAVIIRVTQLFMPNIYILIVGHRVKYAFTNMLIAFFGQSQAALPRENFSRLLLMEFLMFCMVIRGIYQGQLFNIMRKEIFDNMPSTIDDLVEKNYVFYAYESLGSRVQEFKFAKK